MDLTPQGSRRLTGPNLFLPGLGVVLEAPVQPATAATYIAAWRAAVKDLWAQLEWPEPTLQAQPYPGFVTLAASAPEDALYTACEANESAWAQAIAQQGASPPEHLSVAELVSAAATERSPRRRALAAAAAEHGVRFLADDEFVSVGSGRGCKVWPVTGIPDPGTVTWSEVHDIPVALITGTNGKTTTVRMLSAIAAAAGLTAGNTSTDGVQIAGQTVLAGDYTGGEGARALLQNPRVDLAFLEVARGGMLRRGLPVERADVAYVSNIATDHLGEYGIDTLDHLATVKLLVRKAVTDGVLILNGDDARLVPAIDEQTVAVRLDPEPLPREPAFVRFRGRLGAVSGDSFVSWMEQAEVPATFGGNAVHNVYNALGAMAIASSLGLSRPAIVDGLAAFASDASGNPGRGNLFTFHGLRALVDYAHNPEGLELLLELAAALRPDRTLVVLGQAGDRADAAIRSLADACAARQPDRVIVKKMDAYGRGRDPGMIAAMLRDRLLESGMTPDRVDLAADELGAVRDALAWGQSGDLLLLLSHAQRAEVLQLLTDLAQNDWQPGDPLPARIGEESE
jgi:UDP-N-acetylmuramyl tripeptide synthase